MLRCMNVLWVFAHPEPRSLTASLAGDGSRILAELGHEVRVRDLYAMKWNPVVDRTDFDVDDPTGRLFVGPAAKDAHLRGGLAPEIRTEQEHLRWADAVVLHFPLWWHGMPAILKGWVDRVFVNGFAFGVTDPDTGATLRYGDGGLAGRRALVVTSVGAREAAFGPRGIHGELDEVLFNIQHGLFWYTGMAALRPFTVYAADRTTAEDYAAIRARLRSRLAALPTEEPVGFRHQDGGDYDTHLVLRPELAPGRTGLAAHLR